jgi:hypothetical protein
MQRSARLRLAMSILLRSRRNTAGFVPTGSPREPAKSLVGKSDREIGVNDTGRLPDESQSLICQH